MGKLNVVGFFLFLFSNSLPLPLNTVLISLSLFLFNLFCLCFFGSQTVLVILSVRRGFMTQCNMLPIGSFGGLLHFEFSLEAIIWLTSFAVTIVYLCSYFIMSITADITLKATFLYISRTLSKNLFFFPKMAAMIYTFWYLL